MLYFSKLESGEFVDHWYNFGFLVKAEQCIQLTYTMHELFISVSSFIFVIRYYCEPCSSLEISVLVRSLKSNNIELG